MAVELFVPGRLCLFGEHSDWAGGYRPLNPEIEKGYTLVCGTNQGLHARAERLADKLLLSSTEPDGQTRGPIELPLAPERLLAEARGGGYWSYMAGTAYQILSRYPVDGLRLDNTQTDLPLKKGLSSSAAACVLMARAFNRLYGLGLDTREEMELAYLGEITTPSRCGRMDQICAYGGQPALMSFDGEGVEIELLRPGGPLHLVIVDLGGEKDTRRILADLNACYPATGGEIAQGVRRLLGPLNKELVLRAKGALEAGDGRRLGELMSEAQALFDRYAAPASPRELASPLLHRTLAHPALGPLIWGGKGVGSQGDGAAQLVARGADEARRAMALIERELGMGCLEIEIA